MAELSVADMVSDMIKAVKASLGKDYSKAKDFARPELQRLARSLVDIAKLVATDKVTKQQAKSLVAIHQNTTRVVFLTIEGLGIIAVENALNAAIGAIRSTVNGAGEVRFDLIRYRAPIPPCARATAQYTGALTASSSSDFQLFPQSLTTDPTRNATEPSTASARGERKPGHPPRPRGIGLLPPEREHAQERQRVVRRRRRTRTAPAPC